MKKLRLLITEKCNRDCPGCCNKDWDLKTLFTLEPDDNTNWDLIMITGGEPMLLSKNGKLNYALAKLRKKYPLTEIILYTAWSYNPIQFVDQLELFDGVTLTLHEQSDVPAFIELQKEMKKRGSVCMDYEFSKRLNVFSGINIDGVDMETWKVKSNIEWIVNCPLPQDEKFMRLVV